MISLISVCYNNGFPHQDHGCSKKRSIAWSIWLRGGGAMWDNRGLLLFTAAAAFLLGEFTHYTCVAFHKAPWGGGDGGDMCVQRRDRKIP